MRSSFIPTPAPPGTQTQDIRPGRVCMGWRPDFEFRGDIPPPLDSLTARGWPSSHGTCLPKPSSRKSTARRALDAVEVIRNIRHNLG